MIYPTCRLFRLLVWTAWLLGEKYCLRFVAEPFRSTIIGKKWWTENGASFIIDRWLVVVGWCAAATTSPSAPATRYAASGGHSPFSPPLDAGRRRTSTGQQK